MAARTKHNTANGILSAFVMAFGLCFCGLVVGIVKKVVQGNIEIQEQEHDNPELRNQLGGASIGFASSPLWSFGFAYIVPGLIGLIATCVKHKAAYITQMVFSIITLVVMGIVFVLAIFALAALSVSHPGNCMTVGPKCVCDMPGQTDGLPLPYSCEDLTSMYAMGVSTLVVLVLAWVVTLISTIMAGILACSREEIQAGYVLHPAPINGTVAQMGQVAMPPQITYVPNTQDHAQLIHNMAY